MLLTTANCQGSEPFSCCRSFVLRTIFWNLEFSSKTPKRSFFGPLLLRHWCTNPCCSTTAQFVFLVRVARYANHFSSLLRSPKIPFCRMQFLSSRTSRMRLILFLPLSQLPENPCCYITGQCCSPLRTARARNRFPALVRSSIEPFFGISNFVQKHQNAPFFGPLLLRHWCTNPCCSTTAQFVFLVRVARYANHFSSLLGSPKIPFCRVQFLSSRTSRMRLIFCITQPTSRKSMLL